MSDLIDKCVSRRWMYVCRYFLLNERSLVSILFQFSIFSGTVLTIKQLHSY